jgi:hypothetical protein
MLECACGIGWWHPSDSELEKTFIKNRVAFENLLKDVRADKDLKSIGATRVIYHDVFIRAEDDSSAMKRAGLTAEHWERYTRQMKALGVLRITQSDEQVVFKVDRNTVMNGDSEKGYVYSLNVPSRHRKESLDGYRLSRGDMDEDGSVYIYRPLCGHWYLFLYVNR